MNMTIRTTELTSIRRAPLVALAFLVLSLDAFTAKAEEFVVLVNASRRETNLSLHLLARIYRGEIRFWPNRQHIAVILPPAHSSKMLDAFVKSVLNLDPKRYETHWEEKRYRGEVTVMPLKASDEEATITAVAASTNVIALLERDRALRISTNPAVKTLQIDGKPPGQAGYPLVLKP